MILASGVTKWMQERFTALSGFFVELRALRTSGVDRHNDVEELLLTNVDANHIILFLLEFEYRAGPR